VVGATSSGPIPPVRPSASLVSQIRGIPASWGTTATGLPARVSPGALATAIAAAMGTPGGGGAAPATTVREAYRRALALVGAAARSAARSEIRRFVSAQVEPLLLASVTTLQGAISADVARVVSTPAGAVAASSPPDPNLRAVVTAMETRLAAQTPAGQDPASPSASAANPASPTNNPSGAAVPGQEVTYDNRGMMSDNSRDLRVDQFEGLVTQFNDEANGLKSSREDPFTAQVT